MDAANPLSRWSFAAAALFLAAAAGPVLVAAGCQTADPGTPVGRGQSPPYDPLPPVAPAAPYTPTSPAGPVAGQPIPAGYTPGGPGLLKPAVPQGAPAVKVVAHVGKSLVTEQEVWEAVRQRMSEYIYPIDGPNGKEVRRDDAKEQAIFYDELRRIIERELILDEMAERLKKAKPGAADDIKDAARKMADKQLFEFKKMYKVKTDEEFQAILGTQGLTLPVIRRQLERQMMAEEYVRSMIRDKIKGIGLAQIRDYYDRHPDEFTTEDRVKWLDIFVSFNRFPTARATYDHAIGVQQQAAAGADFVALVKQHDHGVASGQNGEGIGRKRGEIRPADVEETVWALRVGQVSGLIETPTGYHIVKVAEREYAGAKPFDAATQDEVRKRLTKQMMEQERGKLVADLWYKGVVKVMIPVP